MGSASLIGENWYSPSIEILNMSSHPITVRRADLETWRATYENKPQRSGAYPVTVAVGKTMPIEVWFDLNDSVEKMPVAWTLKSLARSRTFNLSR